VICDYDTSTEAPVIPACLSSPADGHPSD